MRLFGIKSSENDYKIKFNGTRVLKNTVSQLAKNNRYSLTEPNQRYIVNSINELGKVSGEKNIDFLLNTAAITKLTYSTNIELKDAPKNNWKEMLLGAAAAAISITPLINKTEFAKKIQEINDNKELNETEKEILKLRDSLTEKVDLDQIQKETVGGIKDFQRNLDYFIVSSETTQEHKKYVLERLNYFMSDEYKINPQLETKKSVAAAEMVNDIAIFTPGHKVPNIKAVNQKQHGICAAISIVRKKIAYEDKPNYIDSILSELDATEFIKVYDRSKMGTGAKTNFPKIKVDFEAAMEQGYRIIDASSMQWMQLANMSGYSGISFNNYSPFDKENFDVNTDSFFNAKFDNQDLKKLQEYYQALLKAHSVLKGYKIDKITNDEINRKKRSEAEKTILTMGSVKKYLYQKFNELTPEAKFNDINTVVDGLLKLQHKYSDKILEGDKYAYIPNEEVSSKKLKIKNYITDKLSIPEIGDDTVNNIYDFIDFYNSMEDFLSTPKIGKNKISRARTLYKIGANSRYQFIKGMENESVLLEFMRDKNVPNRETLMLKTVDTLISRLKQNKYDSKYIKESLSKFEGTNIKSNKNAIKLLDKIKKDIEKTINQRFNEIYKSINYKDKEDAFVKYLESIIANISENNKDTLNYIAGSLGIKDSASIVEAYLNDLITEISNGNSDVFEEAFNKLGNYSQAEFMNNLFQDFASRIFSTENESEVTEFILNNNISVNNVEEKINKQLAVIENKINKINNKLDKYASVLKIKNEKGTVLYSPEPADAILKILEKDGTIISTKDLEDLQIHLNQIQKDKSLDEFNSRQGKLKNKELYHFSNNEKQALLIIEKNVNTLYRYVQKQLSKIQRYIREPLEELKRMVGLDMGHWWVGEEGESGLFNGQDIRILEYITGRPHHITSDVGKAIENIKKSPYSGMSSSSVFHDKPGFHAQYIADIEPVAVKTEPSKGKIETKDVDVLFQDNTWGASEHENIWTDSTGFVRTDYSDHRGGTLGYITNDKFLNGNLVNRVVGDMILDEKPSTIDSRLYKKIKKPSLEGLKSPQYTQVILDGISPEAENIAKSIHDTIFVPTQNTLETIKKFASKLTHKELENKIANIKTSSINWGRTSADMLKKIRDSEIKTQDEYNNLADDNPIKLTLEKAAFNDSYKMLDLNYQISKIKNLRELKKFIKIRRERAVENFKYSFGKNINIVQYFVDSLTEQNFEDIEKILKKYNIELSEKVFEDIFVNYEINAEEFNGSLKNTIEVLNQNTSEKIDANIDNKDACEELKTYINNLLKENLYFKTSDIGDDDIQHIVRFIDKTYNPSDNKEFEKIYRSVQDMTIEEFKSEILPKTTDEDLNIKKITGFDLFNKIKRYEPTAETKLTNTVFYDELCTSVEPAKYTNKYENKKLSRRNKTYLVHNFDSAYRELQNDLVLLNTGKLLNKYKEMNLKKYGVYPAYPKLNLMSKEISEAGFNIGTEAVEEYVNQVNLAKNMKEYYTLCDTLKQFCKNFKSEDILTDEQYKKINLILGKIVTLANYDDTQSVIFNLACDALDIEEGSAFKLYKPFIREISKQISIYKKNCGFKDLEKEITVDKRIMDDQISLFLQTFIQKRYQNRVGETLNKYKHFLIKSLDINNKDFKKAEEKAKEYKNRLWEEFQIYHTLQDPVETLNKYLDSLTTDSEISASQKSVEILLQRALCYSKLYDIQSTLMEALEKGIETDVKSAFDNINIYMPDGSVNKMSSRNVISLIVDELLIDNQEETAIMFIDKFGFNEDYVLNIAEEFDEDYFKSLIDDSYTNFINYQKFVNTYTEALNKLYDSLNNNGNLLTSSEEFKRVLARGAKKYSVKKENIANLLKTIDNIKAQCLSNPLMKPAEIFNAVLPVAMSEVASAAESDLADIGEKIEANEFVINLANKINLMPDTIAVKKREELNNKYKSLLEYQKKLYSNLQVKE